MSSKGNELDAAAEQRARDHIYQLGDQAGTRFVNKNVPLDRGLQKFINAPGSPGSSIYINGGIGTGKTQQLVEAGRALIYMAARAGEVESPVMYLTVPEMITNMRSREMMSCLDVPWLLLDEVGYPVAESDFAYLLEVIDARYRYELPIIFASLYSLADLLGGQRPGWDNRISTRILEMCGTKSIPAPDNYIVLKGQHRMPSVSS